MIITENTTEIPYGDITFRCVTMYVCTCMSVSISIICDQIDEIRSYFEK